MADSFLTSPESFNTRLLRDRGEPGCTGASAQVRRVPASSGAVRQGTQTIPTLFSSLTASNSSYSATKLYENC